MCIVSYYIINFFFSFCREPLSNDSTAIVTIVVQHPDLISTEPSNFTITSERKIEWIIYVKGLNAGHSIVSVNITPSNITE